MLINAVDELSQQEAALLPGDKVLITVQRDGRDVISWDVTMQEVGVLILEEIEE